MDKWYKGFTWLGYLNFIILQWFFIRLAKSYEIKDNGFRYKDYKFKILKFIIPLTGWWNDYKYLSWKNGKAHIN